MEGSSSVYTCRCCSSFATEDQLPSLFVSKYWKDCGIFTALITQTFGVQSTDTDVIVVIVRCHVSSFTVITVQLFLLLCWYVVFFEMHQTRRRLKFVPLGVVM